MALLLAVWVLGVRAADEQSEKGEVSDNDMRIEGVFNSALPGTEKKNRLKLLLRPHFGDFHRKDYLRVPLSLRYGLTERWEITGGIESYFSHGLGGVKWFESSGFSAVRFSTKYRIGRRLWRDWDMGVGLDYISPVGSPPGDISDGLRHFGYHASFSRELTSMPDWRVFWSLGADNVSETGRPVVLEKNDLGDDAVNLSGGFVWQRLTHNYTLEMSYATTRLLGTLDRDVVSIRPGVIWKLPKRYTFNARGNWFLGVSTKLSYGADGFDYGLSGKLRASFDFKKWWRGHFPKKTK